MSRSDCNYLNLAKKTAELSSMRQRHGAVIVKGGRVLALGVNKLKNDPNIVNTYGHCSVHAEADAIERAGVDNVARATIYVARINNSGVDRFSRPCDDCAKLIVRSKIKKIVYTTDE